MFVIYAVMLFYLFEHVLLKEKYSLAEREITNRTAVLFTLAAQDYFNDGDQRHVATFN